jgi:hypothetical protein
MIELVDNTPEVNVPPAEYARLLGFPRGHVLEGRALELAQWARQWYAEHGQPWMYARGTECVSLSDGAVTIEGERFASAPLANMLEQAESNGVVVAAVSAGAELEQAAAEAWSAERPDEYFFLEAYGSAVAEHLVTLAGAQLCAWADGERMAVLPHASPGYPQWDVAEQPRLLALITQRHPKGLQGQLDALDSGMLRPKKSLLAVFGLTRQTERVRRLTELSPCESCSFAKCGYRRRAYQGPLSYRAMEVPLPTFGGGTLAGDAAPLNLAANYGVNRKALARWARERLVLDRTADGGVHARFRFDGTTCTNMGQPLAFDYSVRLGSRGKGYPIESGRCEPAADDVGYRAMCRYLDDGDRLLASIASERPLSGQPLDDVLQWSRASCSAGCYCDADSRLHKWGLVLETLHFALAENERWAARHSQEHLQR